ncbi:MAG: hypothetical protein M1828_000275 [Chrysothrix sp. TS-e1954]|nr:MAG: hypothetical protein M1828_000275 [Chrysothrix sp. TS-e1954]
MTPSDFLSFLYRQLFLTLPHPTGTLTGKPVIVTGSNTGLGLEAARHFAQLSPRKLIIACRNVSAGEAAKESILASTLSTSTAHKSPAADPDAIEVWQLDLSSYASVQAFAARAENKLERLDVVVENAGIATQTFRLMEDNEATLTTNVVSTFLLALLLLPKMKHTAATHDTTPTLTVVSSDVHGWTTIPERAALSPGSNLFDALNDPSKAVMTQRYPVSKLLEVLAVRAMASQAAQTCAPGQSYPVTINAVNPGLCKSALSREATGALKLNMTIMLALLARSLEVGSRTLVHAGLSGPESQGQYLSDCNVRQPSEFVRSREGGELQGVVWRELVGKLEGIRPGVVGGL